MTSSAFFDYVCDRCGKPFCERILVMNLAMDKEDEQYCLECLAVTESQITPPDFFVWISDYIQARDCFKSPWDKFNVTPCPRITDKTCYCHDTK